VFVGTPDYACAVGKGREVVDAFHFVRRLRLRISSVSSETS
jgi:hypothetical protein